VLVEIDAREPRAQAERARAGQDELERAVEGATANAQLAESTYRRFEALRERGSASQQEYDEARARHTAARADLARLTASRHGARAAVTQAVAVLGYSSVRAPIAGVVTARFVDPGAQAAPGVPLVAIEEERVKEAVAVSPDRKWSLHLLAELACTSPCHLARVFRESTGTSIHQYLLRLRLALALRRLLASEADLATIASDLGFSSHSHFSARFRALFGTTPTEIRRNGGGDLGGLPALLA
jgi:AraC-like DNA-binding protein